MDPTPSPAQSQSKTPVQVPVKYQTTPYPGKPLQQTDTVILTPTETESYDYSTQDEFQTEKTPDAPSFEEMREDAKLKNYKIHNFAYEMRQTVNRRNYMVFQTDANLTNMLIIGSTKDRLLAEMGLKRFIHLYQKKDKYIEDAQFEIVNYDNHYYVCIDTSVKKPFTFWNFIFG